MRYTQASNNSVYCSLAVLVSDHKVALNVPFIAVAWFGGTEKVLWPLGSVGWSRSYWQCVGAAAPTHMYICT